MTPKDTYVVDYPEAVELAQRQLSIFWPPEEVRVEKDVQDILVNLTEAERHGVLTTLKLFTLYEVMLGEEYWSQVREMFKHPACIGRMASTFSFFELGIHSVFYNKINEVLGIATEEFHSSWKDDAILRDRMEELEAHAVTQRPAEFLMMLAFAEGVILYSSFAFLKHFQAEGKNKISNIVRGIDFSVRDESIHCEASAWLFRTLLEEEGEDIKKYEEMAHHLANVTREHEYAIVDKIFEKGKIEGITDVQMKNFIDSRCNLVLRMLGFDNLFSITYNPIATWFYDNINSFMYNDFFSGQGREYSRTWDEGDLTW